jgi:hypothetical protein
LRGRAGGGCVGVGPEDFHGHAGAEVGNVGAVELGYYVVAVAGSVYGGADFDDARGKLAAGIFNQRKFYRRAWSGAATRRFWNLKLDLQRRELADTKTFVAFGNRLAFAEVAADYYAGEGSMDAGLFFF